MAGGYIIDADGAGITLNYDFNQYVGATLYWLRAENRNASGTIGEYKGLDASHDAMDFVGLNIPIKGDGFKLTPFAIYGNIGRASFDDIKSNSGDLSDLRHYMLPVGAGWALGDPLYRRQLDDNGTAWWAGLGGELTLFSPFRLALDAAYGSLDMGSVDKRYTGDKKDFELKRQGWMVTALAEYKLDFMTPGLIFWYGSGDDDDAYNGSERMPSINPGWAATPFGFDGGTFDGYDKVSKTPAGTWGLGLRLKDITFVENLKHLLQVTYYRGTNDTEMANYIATPFSDYTDANGAEGYAYMTKDDWAWEVNLNSQYKIYEDLTMYLDLGYIRMDIDENTWKIGSDDYNKNLYKVGVYMRYDF